MTHELKSLELMSRIQNYLENGGLFNPEMMEHSKVRDLLMDIHDYLKRTPSPKAESEEGMTRSEFEAAVKLHLSPVLSDNYRTKGIMAAFDKTRRTPSPEREELEMLKHHVNELEYGKYGKVALADQIHSIESSLKAAQEENERLMNYLRWVQTCSTDRVAIGRAENILDDIAEKTEMDLLKSPMTPKEQFLADKAKLA